MAVSRDIVVVKPGVYPTMLATTVLQTERTPRLLELPETYPYRNYKAPRRPDWHPLPLTRYLGFSLQFRAFEDESGEENFFVTLMSIDPDFSRRDQDIEQRGFESSIYESVLGPVEVSRTNGRDLTVADAQVILEYVVEKFPRPQHLGPLTPPYAGRLFDVRFMRQSWVYGGRGTLDKFARWRTKWLKENIRLAEDEYNSRVCSMTVS